MTSPGEQASLGIPELAGVLLSEQTLSELLDVVVNLAVLTIDRVEGASISILERDGPRLETSNASSTLIRSVDEAQYKAEAGPCVAAIRLGTEITIVLPDAQWVEFSDRAFAAGMRSVSSFPLIPETVTIGALNLYSGGAEGWDAPAMAAGRGLAQQAAIVLANAIAFTTAQLANRHLQEALESRDLIGQAKGMLMASQQITADQSFDILRRASQRTGRKLRDIASDIVNHQLAPEV